MDNYHVQLLHETNKRMIEAMGMHWENEEEKQIIEQLAQERLDKIENLLPFFIDNEKDEIDFYKISTDEFNEFYAELLKRKLESEREEKDLILRKVSAEVDIDQSLISKFEKNERKPTKEQIVRLSKFYGLSEKELIINWYSERIAEELKYTQSTYEILRVAEEKINYFNSQNNGK